MCGKRVEEHWSRESKSRLSKTKTQDAGAETEIEWNTSTDSQIDTDTDWQIIKILTSNITSQCLLETNKIGRTHLCIPSSPV